MAKKLEIKHGNTLTQEQWVIVNTIQFYNRLIERATHLNSGVLPDLIQARDELQAELTQVTIAINGGKS